MSAEAMAEALQARVGAELGVGEWFAITQERVDRFAEATCDRQWIHVDPVRAARESPFGAAVAHGFLTLSLIPHLAASVPTLSAAQRARVRLAVNYGLGKVRFPAPVRVGARVRARGELVSAQAIGDAVQVVRRVVVEIEGQPKPACVAETIARYYLAR